MTKLSIMERREKVKGLYYVQRMTIREIATSLGNNKETIHKDLKVIDVELSKEIKNFNVEDLIKKRKLEGNQVVNKMWINYVKESDTYKKTRILRMIEQASSSFIKDMQELNLIPKPTEKLEVDNKQPPAKVIVNIKELPKTKK